MGLYLSKFLQLFTLEASTALLYDLMAVLNPSGDVSYL